MNHNQVFNFGYSAYNNHLSQVRGVQDNGMDNLFQGHNDSGVNTKANIKQYIFSTIDNVLGGGQSSTS